MITLYGVTEDGTSVPVQVTDDGKIVAVGQTGPAGPEGPQGPPGPQGEPGLPGSVQPGDDVTFGRGNFTGNVIIEDLNPDESRGIDLKSFGALVVRRHTAVEKSILQVQNNRVGGSNSIATITNFGNYMADGSLDCASGKAGFTADGSLYFTERGETWKLIPSSNGLVTCEQIDPVQRSPLTDLISEEPT